MNDRLIEFYGTSDLSTVTGIWQSDPTTVPVAGEWGFSHAALSLNILQVARVGGATNNQLQVLAQQQVERWFAREAVSRCNNGLINWLNPLLWSEDSRLDYWSPFIFINWYMAQI